MPSGNVSTNKFAFQIFCMTLSRDALDLTVGLTLTAVVVASQSWTLEMVVAQVLCRSHLSTKLYMNFLV
jgi:hypothetical protein